MKTSVKLRWGRTVWKVFFTLLLESGWGGFVQARTPEGGVISLDNEHSVIMDYKVAR